MKITRAILDVMIHNPNLDFSQDDLVYSTRFQKKQINMALFFLRRGKLVCRRVEPYPRPPFKKPFYFMNFDKLVKIEKLVEEEYKQNAKQKSQG